MDKTGEQVDFGFRNVAPDEKTRLVDEVFTSVAQRYDLMNDLMSFGAHRLMKRMLVEMSSARPGHSVLDLAGGTGGHCRFAGAGGGRRWPGGVGGP